MPGNGGDSILCCINSYQTTASKRRRTEAAPAVCTSVPVNFLRSDSTSDPSNSAAKSARTEAEHSCTQAQHLSAKQLCPPSNVKARNFYGSNKLLLIDQRVARLCANAQRRLGCKEIAPFERFSLQRQAFAWAEAHELAADLKTFSVEHDSTGRRSFLVSTCEGFWYRYQDMLPDHRHYYEIIQESRPCHLYFDLEFLKEYNAGVNGENMVDYLLTLVTHQLKAAFGIDLNPAWVMELESDAHHKFSRHLIIQIPGMAFANNLEVGSFVSAVCDKAVQPSSSSLQVAKEGGTCLIVDGSVYTRNRAFRLYLSSKAGKSSILRPTGRFPNKAHSPKQVFMQSLICKGGVQGCVRSWVLWDDIGVFLYNIKDNRWCGNIGRAHKSNGIFIIADLQAGVWYQRCYDPDCVNYRSEMMPLPPALVRECHGGEHLAQVREVSSAGVLKDCEDGDEGALLAALEMYESAAVK